MLIATLAVVLTGPLAIMQAVGVFCNTHTGLSFTAPALIEATVMISSVTQIAETGEGNNRV